MKKIILPVIFFVLCISSVSYAADFGIDSVLDYIDSFSSGSMIDILYAYARRLFITLSTFSLALGLIRMLLSGESNVGAFASHIAKWILYVGIFTWLMNNNIHKLIINSFVTIGSELNGTGEIRPDDILVSGIRIYGTLVQRGWEAGWGDFLGVTLLGLIILVVIAMIAGLFALALVEMHLVICGGAVLLGFGGFDFTRDIAMSYLRYIISVGMKLLMIMIVYGLAGQIIPSWEADFSSANSMSELIISAGQILGGTICVFMIVLKIPDAAQAIVNRASMTLGHPVYNTNSMPYVDNRPSSMQSSGGLVRTMMNALRLGNSQTQNQQSIPNFSPQNQINHANTRSFRNLANTDGMLTGSGYTPVGSMQGSRQVINPANAASMENYVPPVQTINSGNINSLRGFDTSRQSTINPMNINEARSFASTQQLTTNSGNVNINSFRGFDTTQQSTINPANINQQRINPMNVNEARSFEASQQSTTNQHQNTADLRKLRGLESTQTSSESSTGNYVPPVKPNNLN